MLGDILERTRVQAHVGSGERLARGRDRSDLTPLRRRTRELLLDELEVYWRAGRFPKNTVSDELTPVFVDPSGTHCAIAHLMTVGGAGELVRELATTQNYSYVPALARDSRVSSWLEAAGFTVDEAARIQPSYCQSSPADCVCAGAGRPTMSARARAVGPSQLEVAETTGVGEGQCATIKPGDVIDVTFGTTPGAEYVASLRTPESLNVITTKPMCLVIPIVVVDGGGNASCTTTFGGPVALPHPLSASQLAAYVSTADCTRWLALDGSEWADEPSCGGGCAIPPREPRASAAADLSTIAILTSVLAYRAARRALKR